MSIKKISSSPDVAEVTRRSEVVKVQNPHFYGLLSVIGNWRHARCFRGITHEVDSETTNPRADIIDGHFHLVLPRNMDELSLYGFMHYLVSRANMMSEEAEAAGAIEVVLKEEIDSVDSYLREVIAIGRDNSANRGHHAIARAMIEYAYREILANGQECPISLPESDISKSAQLGQNRVRALLEDK